MGGVGCGVGSFVDAPCRVWAGVGEGGRGKRCVSQGIPAIPTPSGLHPVVIKGTGPQYGQWAGRGPAPGCLCPERYSRTWLQQQRPAHLQA